MIVTQEASSAKQDSIEFFNVIVAQARRLEDVENIKAATCELRAFLKELMQLVSDARTVWLKKAEINRSADYLDYAACDALAVSFVGVLDKIIERPDAERI